MNSEGGKIFTTKDTKITKKKSRKKRKGKKEGKGRRKNSNDRTHLQLAGVRLWFDLSNLSLLHR